MPRMKQAHVPGSRTLMPAVIQILQENGGTLSYSQVSHLVGFKFDIPKNLTNKLFREVGFCHGYLKRIGALAESKKGIWVLSKDYIHLSFDEAKRISYDKYDILLGRKDPE
ncbi:hypothetical protein LAD12857_29130 [Lacrimispora amygdalina]|uniref:Restriction system protein Mrr-like N-terminal domain-containing protein n=1 Tax=Lacrimispora amygdalina TaxID=253257 RepID=A0ABQ5M8P1_9FIRM